MIQKIQLNNFQSHKKTELVFSPGVNVIVGSSDSGKSAILRGLRWCAWNKPGGEAFRSHWGGPTSVKLTIDDSVITRGKDKANTYHLNKTEFKAFGTDVPEEITKLLNMDDTNLQQQLDIPFLLTTPSGQVASYFNKIAKLDKIGSSLKKINSKIKKENDLIVTNTESVKNKKIELASFDYLEKLEIQLEGLEGQQENRNSQQKKKKQLSDLCVNYYEADTAIGEWKDTLKLKPFVEAILDAQNEQESKIDEYKVLEGLIKASTKLETRQKELQRLLDVQSVVSEITLLTSSVKEQRKESRTLKDSIDAIYITHKKYTKVCGNHENLKITFAENMPKICPLCKTHLDGKN